MRRFLRAVRLMAVPMLGLLAGCAGTERLASAMATINQDYSRLQDEALLLNIVRRSANLPAHFTTVTTIRGRSRLFAGANMTLPFGGEAPSDFSFNPHLSVEQGPGFDVSTQDNQEFYRGYVAPISTTSLAFMLRQDYPAELILSLFLERVQIQRPGKTERYFNNPSAPAEFARFQKMINRLVDQGITMETAFLVSRYGPELELKQAPSIDQLLSARKEKLIVRANGKNRYELTESIESARFCFIRPREELFKHARCELESLKEFKLGDPDFFGSVGEGRVFFEAKGIGKVELHTRSLAEVFDYLGECVREQEARGASLTIRTPDGEQPIIRVETGMTMDAVVSTEFAGDHYSIPKGRDGGQSGAVLSMVSQLLAQAQSVKDMPLNNTINLIGQ
ncbi:hypothetical protein [Stutzerimonas chloritidismutans]|uniref:hypothetical protein n=1 Tax=Stutzerimonas chloritidismutans TaxID=203192 RepID=UPI003F13868F